MSTNLLISFLSNFSRIDSSKHKNRLILITNQLSNNSKSIEVELNDLTLSSSMINEIVNLKSQILYPGEKLFNNLTIKTPCILEKFIKNNNIILSLYDLEFYRIPHYEIKSKENLILLKLNSSFSSIQIDKSNHSDKISICNLALNVNSTYRTKVGFDGSLKFSPNLNAINLVINKKETLSLASNKYLSLNLIKKKDSYIPRNSSLGFLELVSQEKQKIKEWKLDHKSKLFLFFTSDVNYSNYFLDQNNFSLKENDFVFKGDKISSTFYSPISGQVKEIRGNSIQIQRACPYLFSKGTYLVVSNNDFVFKNENLGLFLFEKTITGDIVQGLPKVEEILEARKASTKGRLTKDFGLFLFDSTYKINIKQTRESDTKAVNFCQVILLTRTGIQDYRRLLTNLTNL